MTTSDDPLTRVYENIDDRSDHNQVVARLTSDEHLILNRVSDALDINQYEVLAYAVLFAFHPERLPEFKEFLLNRVE